MPIDDTRSLTQIGASLLIASVELGNYMLDLCVQLIEGLGGYFMLIPHPQLLRHFHLVFGLFLIDLYKQNVTRAAQITYTHIHIYDIYIID